MDIFGSVDKTYYQHINQSISHTWASIQGENWLWGDELLLGEACSLPSPGGHLIISTPLNILQLHHLHIHIIFSSSSYQSTPLSSSTSSSPYSESPSLSPTFFCQRTSPRVRLAEVMADPKKENESPKGEQSNLDNLKTWQLENLTNESSKGDQSNLHSETWQYAGVKRCYGSCGSWSEPPTLINIWSTSLRSGWKGAKFWANL